MIGLHACGSTRLRRRDIPSRSMYTPALHAPLERDQMGATEASLMDGRNEQSLPRVGGD